MEEFQIYDDKLLSEYVQQRTAHWQGVSLRHRSV